MNVKQLRKSRTTRKGWIRKLDHVVTEICRLRDKTCVTCGSRSNLGTGHLFSRVAYSTRWDITKNCNLQCNSCNFRHEIDPFKYTSWFLKKYGQDAYDELHRLYKQPVILKDWQLEEMFNQLTTVKKAMEEGEYKW